MLIFFRLTLIVGILAGIYPALVLSNYKLVKMPKGSVLGDQELGKIPFLIHGLVEPKLILADEPTGNLNINRGRDHGTL